MEKLNDLRDLLKMELQDLYSVEEQILEALPKMIEKATNPQLKSSLQEHLQITEQHRARLEKLQEQFGNESKDTESSGLLSRLFKSRFVCEGMQGIIKESNKVLGTDMDSDVMDAAIIACAQKVEHYEICGYGTARAYAEELGLSDVAGVLLQTLNEEYDADDKLTALAESRINRRAQDAGTTPEADARGRNAAGSKAAKAPAPLQPASAERAGGTRRGAEKATPSAPRDAKTAAPRSGASRNAASSGTTGRDATTGRSISGSSSGRASAPAAPAKSAVSGPRGGGGTPARGAASSKSAAKGGGRKR